MASHRAYVQQELGGKLELKNVPTPSPGAGEVLVDVLATPILSYTNAVLAGSLFPLVHPLTPGISAIGRIHATGIDSTVLQNGQLVFCVPIIRARDDAGSSILHGWFGGATPEARKLMEGPWRNGAWAEKMIVPTENIVPLDENRLLGELGYTIPQLVWSMFLQ
jgi:NADPH:quinone reductase-like Zn-dependent oxidoreductase